MENPPNKAAHISIYHEKNNKTKQNKVCVVTRQSSNKGSKISSESSHFSEAWKVTEKPNLQGKSGRAVP